MQVPQTLQGGHTSLDSRVESYTSYAWGWGEGIMVDLYLAAGVWDLPSDQPNRAPLRNVACFILGGERRARQEEEGRERVRHTLPGTASSSHDLCLATASRRGRREWLW